MAYKCVLPGKGSFDCNGCGECQQEEEPTCQECIHLEEDYCPIKQRYVEPEEAEDCDDFEKDV